ncbi:MAG TPA: PDDEXK nuclease domain-containing protein [Chitinophagaceae bacterium]|nr:PDDEXK nuclease domain-containing protein [Chitinophagaceae bacterium]
MPRLSSLFKDIKILIETSRLEVVQIINTKMVGTYFQIGRLIVEFEQRGKSRAKYAANTLKDLSKNLIKEFGKGFSVDNLENMRKFYLLYRKSETLSRKSGLPKNSQKSETLSRKSVSIPVFKLSWSHYILLLRIEKEDERKFYEIEAAQENWSVRELKRQYDSALYERLVLSRNKKKIKELGKKGQVIESATDLIKDPYILEFLSLQEQESYSENDLETAILNKLEYFLRELGKGFLFVNRQYRITLDEEHFHIDLVFYQRILRCFILIDLKIGELQHRDIGQMQMYVNYFDEEVKEAEENKTIGIILCKNKKESIVKYTLPKGGNQIFASKYKTYLPDKNELKLLMEPEVAYVPRTKNE